MSDRQIKISVTLLREMLVEAYQGGWCGVQELDGDTADKIIESRITEEMTVKPPAPPTTPPFSSAMPFVGVAQPLLVHGLPLNVNGWMGQQSNIIISSDLHNPIQVVSNMPDPSI